MKGDQWIYLAVFDCDSLAVQAEVRLDFRTLGGEWKMHGGAAISCPVIWFLNFFAGYVFLYSSIAWLLADKHGVVRTASRNHEG